MSTQITTAFVQQYNANLTLLVQQKGSKLRNCLLNDVIKGESDYFDQIGATHASERTGRHSETPQTDMPHSRRMLTLKDWHCGDLIDKQDKIRMLTDPTSEYAQSFAYALGRQIDGCAVDAILGIAKAGKTGSESVSLPAAQKIAHGDTGLTLDKLLQTLEIMNAQDVPEEERYLAATAKQMTNLLQTTEVTSTDYNSVKSLVNGQVDTFLGFKFISLNGTRAPGIPIVPLTEGIRSCFAFQKTGARLGFGADIETKIDPRPDKCYATQVYSTMTAGAVRMEEAKVVQIDCKE